MRVLIIGGAGMLGHKLYQLYRERYETWATVRGACPVLPGGEPFDSARVVEGVDAFRFDTVVRAMATVKPDAVINCVGIVKQLPTAKDPLVSLEINSLLPHRLAGLCQAAGARMIHISTDCVFSGRKGMYTEEDVSDAEDLYGRSKFLGEVDAPGCLTMRTSIIGREMKTASGLVEWFLANRGGRVGGFTRAVYTGFTTQALAAIIADVLNNHAGLQGVYQVSSDPINKFELLKLVDDTYKTNTIIEPETEFACDRSLDSTRFRTATGFQPRPWPEMIEEMFHDSTPYDETRVK